MPEISVFHQAVHGRPDRNAPVHLRRRADLWRHREYAVPFYAGVHYREFRAPVAGQQSFGQDVGPAAIGVNRLTTFRLKIRPLNPLSLQGCWARPHQSVQKPLW